MGVAREVRAIRRDARSFRGNLRRRVDTQEGEFRIPPPDIPRAPGETALRDRNEVRIIPNTPSMGTLDLPDDRCSHLPVVRPDHRSPARIF
jgi:hypothetical protein